MIGMEVEDRFFKILLTIAIPTLILTTIVFGYHGIMNLDIHSLVNCIGMGILILFCIIIRNSLKEG